MDKKIKQKNYEETDKNDRKTKQVYYMDKKITKNQ